jgi:DNA-binding IclR family transcriptional regulator
MARAASSAANSVLNACQLLKEAADMGLFTLSDMARTLDLPTSTTDRLLKALIQSGFIEKSGGQYQIGMAAARLWASYRSVLDQIIREAEAKKLNTEYPAHVSPARSVNGQPDYIDAEFQEGISE